MSVHLIGAYLIGVHLIDVYFMDMYIPDPPSYRRWSMCRNLSRKIRVFALVEEWSLAVGDPDSCAKHSSTPRPGLQNRLGTSKPTAIFKPTYNNTNSRQ